MPTLEMLLSPADKKRLMDAVPLRYSCRRFGTAVSLGDWSALSFLAGRYRMPGARLILTRVDEALFVPSMSGAGQISGCTTVAAVIIEQGQLRSRLYAGILGEAFCLEAAAMGLQTCWVSDSFRERMLELPIKPYERLMCLIAVGHAASPFTPERDRQPLERICAGAPKLWPEQLRLAAQLVREAPSIRNLQPWQLTYAKDRFSIHLSDFASAETGIAALHAELALDYPHQWHFARGTWEDAAWAEAPEV